LDTFWNLLQHKSQYESTHLLWEGEPLWSLSPNLSLRHREICLDESYLHIFSLRSYIIFLLNCELGRLNNSGLESGITFINWFGFCPFKSIKLLSGDELEVLS